MLQPRHNIYIYTHSVLIIICHFRWGFSNKNFNFFILNTTCRLSKNHWRQVIRREAYRSHSCNAKTQSSKAVSQHPSNAKTQGSKPAPQHPSNAKKQGSKPASQHHFSAQTQSLKPASETWNSRHTSNIMSIRKHRVWGSRFNTTAVPKHGAQDPHPASPQWPNADIKPAFQLQISPVSQL